LRELGVTSVRDVPALQRLAQNWELYGELLDISNVAFTEGIEINKQYGIVANTVAEKLNLVTNNFTALIATVGAGGTAIGPLLDGLNAMLKHFTELANNPFVQVLSSIVGVISVLTGVMFLLGSGMARMVASGLAMTQVFREAGSVVATVAKEQGVLGAVISVTTGKILQEVAAINAANVGLVKTEQQVKTTAKSVGFLSTTLKGIGWAALLSVIFEVGSAIYNEFSKQFQTAEQRANSYFGSLAGLSEAVKQDTAIWQQSGEAIATRQVALDKDIDATLQNRKAIDQWIGSQEDAADAAKNTSNVVGEQTIAFGANTAAWLTDSLVDNEGFKKIAQDPKLQEQLRAAGLDFQELLKQGLDSGNAEGYVDALITRIDTRLQTARASAHNEAASWQALGGTTTTSAAEAANLQAVYSALSGTIREYAVGVDNAALYPRQGKLLQTT